MASTEDFPLPDKTQETLDCLSDYIDNFNIYTKYFFGECFKRNETLFIDPITNFRSQYIVSKKTYSLNIKTDKGELQYNQWPIMLGSLIDLRIRYLKQYSFSEYPVEPYPLPEPVEPLDWLYSCFIINGILESIPMYLTNSTCNLHKGKKFKFIIYSYDKNLVGVRMSLNILKNTITIKDKKGKKRKNLSNKQLANILKDLYPFDIILDCVDSDRIKEAYFEYAKHNPYAIDSLQNKKIFTPGELLFRQIMYYNISDKQKKTKIISSSIDTGQMLSNISKSNFNTGSTFTSNEIEKSLSSNNQVLFEKKESVYRRTNTQIVPLVPLLCQQVIRLFTSKISRSPKPLTFSNTNLGFLDAASALDTKNIGKQFSLVKNVVVSDMGKQGLIEEILKTCFKIVNKRDNILVAINDVPFYVKCVYIDKILNLKKINPHNIEFITLKKNKIYSIYVNQSGRLFRKEENISPREAPYAAMNINNITSLFTDLCFKYKCHTMAAKIFLSRGTSKNSILNMDPKINHYFLETNGCYLLDNKFMKNMINSKWKMNALVINQIFASCENYTAEDCIVVKNSSLAKINIVMTMSIKISLNAIKPEDIKFQQSFNSKKSNYLGKIYETKGRPFLIKFINYNSYINKVNAFTYKIYTTKENIGFGIKSVDIAGNNIVIHLEHLHTLESADKLCSWNGQKGMIYGIDNFYECEGVDIDCAISPTCIAQRQTMGHLVDMINRGGKMYSDVYFTNKQGVKKKIEGSFMIGPSSYMIVNNLGINHIYTSSHNFSNYDSITGAAIKGGLRNGGYKISTQDIYTSLEPQHLNEPLYQVSKSSDLMIFDDKYTMPKSSMVSMEILKHQQVEIEPQLIPNVTKL